MPVTTHNILPSLLDRLTDDESESVHRSVNKMSSEKALRTVILRDLNWLLNTWNLQSVGFPAEVKGLADSVLNYGVKDLSNIIDRRNIITKIKDEIRQAIIRFEPRIAPSSLIVEEQERDDPNSHDVSFLIQGELVGQNEGQYLFCKTNIDIDLKSVSVKAR